MEASQYLALVRVQQPSRKQTLDARERSRVAFVTSYIQLSADQAYRLQVDNLLAHRDDQIGLMVRNSPRCRDPRFLDHLVAESLRTSFEDPGRAVALGRIAVEACELLDLNGDCNLSNVLLKSKALIHLGNALRVVANLEPAAIYLKAAKDLLVAHDQRDTDAWARLLHHMGLYRSTQRRFTDAIQFFDEALSLLCSDENSLARCRIEIAKGTTLGEIGALPESIQLLQRAIADLDHHPVSRHLLAAKHNLLLALVEAERLDEAKGLLPEVRCLHREFNDSVSLLRLAWVEAELAMATGDLVEAEQSLLSVKQEFLNREMSYEVAQVSLHLAGLYVETGQVSEIRSLVSEVLAVFNSLGIHRESIAALVLLQRAIEMERLTAELVKEAASYFQQARSQPGLRFRPQGW